jgi:hypothetical protein
MNEQNEINGDLRDEYLALQAADAAEAEECNREAPEPAPLTSEELDDWYQTWAQEEAARVPNLVPDGEEADGTPIWRFQ